MILRRQQRFVEVDTLQDLRDTNQVQNSNSGEKLQFTRKKTFNFSDLTHAAYGTHHPHRPLGGVRDKMGLISVHLGASGTSTDGGVVSPMQFSLAVVRRLLLCALP